MVGPVNQFFLETIENRKEAPLLRLLKDLGGWPVVMGDDWIPESFDWQSTVAKLRQYNNDILVAVWVGPDGKDSDDYIVQVNSEYLIQALKTSLPKIVNVPKSRGPHKL